MSHTPATDPLDGVSRWHQFTRAFLGGLVVASALFFLIAIVQTPGLDPPPQTAALFLVATAAGAVSYLLLADRPSAGYAGAMLTGLFVVTAVALVVAGLYGPAGDQTNPIGPVAYLALAGAVVVTAGLSWRSRMATEPSLDRQAGSG